MSNFMVNVNSFTYNVGRIAKGQELELQNFKIEQKIKNLEVLLRGYLMIIFPKVK